MRALRWTLVPAALVALCAAVPTGAEGLRVVSADDRGVTLEVSAAGWAAHASADGRSRLAVSGAYSLAMPGRPALPAFGAVVAIPPDARPSIRVLDGSDEVARRDVRPTIAGRPTFEPGPRGDDRVPAEARVDPIVDGIWPGGPAELGTPFDVRGRRFITVEVRPFRWDEAGGVLSVRERMRVRVEFSRPAGARALPEPATAAEDAHWDPVFESSVVNFEQARAWRVAPTPPARRPEDVLAAGRGGSGRFELNDAFPAVRVKLDSTGLYGLDYDELEPKGYPVGVPVAEVSVHRHEFVEGANPPLVTIEYPIDIQDFNANGVFDSGDRIWLYARDWASRSGVSFAQRHWGDAEVVFVTRRAGGGLRMARRSGWRGQVGLTPPASYPYSQRFEQSTSFMTFAPDTTVDPLHWTEVLQYYNRDVGVRFDISHCDTSRGAAMDITWRGRNSGLTTHIVSAAIRNGRGTFGVVDSSSFTGRGVLVSTRNLVGTAMADGSNTLLVWGKRSFGPPAPSTNDIAFVGLDYFDARYWRRYRSLNSVAGYMPFNSADEVGEIQLKGQGFASSDIRVFDVTNPDSPVRVMVEPGRAFNEPGIGWAFEIQDSVASRRQYVAASEPKLPPSDQITAYTRRNLYASSGADWMVVAPEAFVAALQPLVSLRQSQGLRTLVAPLESVQDEFAGGRHTPWAIRRMTKFAYEQWGLKFLLVVGTGSLDPRNGAGAAVADLMPTPPIRGPVGPGTSDGLEVVGSDAWYACFNAPCDAINPGSYVPIVLPVMVGRISSLTAQEVAGVVAKIVNYEGLSGDPAWRRNVLLNSDDAFSGLSTFGGDASTSDYRFRNYELRFRALNQKIESIIRRDAGLAQMNVEQFDLRSYLINEPFVASGSDTVRPDLSATQLRSRTQVTPFLFARLNPGTLWWNFQGHANQQQLGHELFYKNIFTDDDVQSFTNAQRPLLFSAFSCHANALGDWNNGRAGRGPSLGEDMVNLAGAAGAIASWASVSYEVVPRDDSTHLNVEFARKLFADPPRDRRLGAAGARAVLGEVIAAAQLAYLPAAGASLYERGLPITYILMGDPATRISVGEPQSIVTANAQPVTDTQPVRLHTPGDALTLIADLVSNVRLDSLGLYREDASGTTPIPASAYTLSPAFPDTANGGTFGGRRFRLTYASTLEPRSYRYVFRVADRNGLRTRFTVPFQLDGVLRSEGTAINDNDEVSPSANLSILLLSPKPIVPASDVTLTINGAAQAFTATAAPGDASGREWILSWTHSPYPIDTYEALVSIAGGESVARRFRVSVGASELRLSNLFAFPNPFDDDGTAFTFTLLGSERADVKIRVFTKSGRLVYSRVERSLAPGYHQLRWDGLDGDGDKLANDVYFFRASAVVPGGAHAEQTGRLVKLRKPRRAPPENTALAP